ncbi:MAG: CoA-binding protein [Bacteroidia bacterium]|nr:CoA-binding protein [Bacteroidia bacterium]
MSKRTLVVGASANPDRYSFIATEMLKSYEHEVYPYGLRAGKIGSAQIETVWPTGQLFDTVTMYVGSQNQESYIKPILELKPKRVIFNPGTENADFAAQLKQHGIEPIEACTLVMLRTKQY